MFWLIFIMLCFPSGHFAADEIKEKIDDLDQKWLEFKVRPFHDILHFHFY